MNKSFGFVVVAIVAFNVLVSGYAIYQRDTQSSIHYTKGDLEQMNRLVQSVNCEAKQDKE